MRVPMIAGNWKMNTTVSEAVELVNEMRPGLDEIASVDKVICPPFISLATVRELKGNLPPLYFPGYGKGANQRQLNKAGGTEPVF